MKYQRRSFLKKSIATSAMLPFLGSSWACASPASDPDKLDISIFSKHLQFLDYSKTGQMAAEIGFDGVALTVRPKGHVLPENATIDLPKAVKAIRDAGSECKMLTTRIESANNPLDVNIIRAAGKTGVSYYRTNSFRYSDEQPMTESLEDYKEEVYQLGLLNKEHGVVGYYQNHAGTRVGSSFWEIQKILEKVDPSHFGTQYDIRHATVDGGYSWENGLKLLQKNIKALAIKDFKWGNENGKWKATNVPIGEGMVDFKRYFKLLKGYGLNPPISLHLEYPIGGAEHGEFSISVDEKVVYDAMRKDLLAVRKLWREA